MDQFIRVESRPDTVDAAFLRPVFGRRVLCQLYHAKLTSALAMAHRAFAGSPPAPPIV